MKVSEAITKANQLRINTLGDDIKAEWLNALEGEVAELMDVECPVNNFPEDQDLLMPREHEQVYPLYLVAKIDYFNGEFDLYNNDIVVFNDAFHKACAWYRRHNVPKSSGHWRL